MELKLTPAGSELHDMELLIVPYGIETTENKSVVEDLIGF